PDIDIEKAVRLLADPLCRTPGAFTVRVHYLAKQVEQVREAHAEAMAESKRILAAEKASAVTRIRALEEELKRYCQAHADSMASADHVLAAEKNAAEARIRQLEKEVENHERAQAGVAWLAAQQTGAAAAQLWRIALERSIPARAARRLGRMLSGK